MAESAAIRMSTTILNTDASAISSKEMHGLLKKFRNSYEVRLTELDERSDGQETDKIRLRILQSYVRDLTAQNDELLSVVEDLQSEANGRISLLDEKLNETTSALKNTENKLQNSELRVKEMNMSLQSGEKVHINQIVDLQNRLREMQTFDKNHHDLLKSELERKDETIQKLRHDMLCLQESRDSVQTQLQIWEDKFHHAESELLDCNRKKEQYNQELQLHKTRTLDLEQELEAVKTHLSRSLAQVLDLKKKLQKIDDTSKETAHSLSAQLNEKLDFENELKSQLKLTDAKYKEALAKSEQYTGTIKQLQDEIQLTAAMSHESKQRGIIEGELVLHYQESYQKAVIEIESLKHELQENELKIQKCKLDCREMLAKGDEQIDKLTTDKQLLEDKICLMHQQTTDFENQTKNLLKENSVALEQLSKKSRVIQELEIDLSRAKEQLSFKADTVSQHEVKVDQLEKEISRVRLEIQEALEENGRLEARLRAFTLTAESDHSLFQGEVRRREDAIQKLMAQQLILQETISKQEEKVLQATTTIEKLESDKNSHEVEILKERNTSLCIKEDLNEAKRKHSGFQKEIAQLQEKIGSMNLDLTTCKAQQEHLQKSLQLKEDLIFQVKQDNESLCQQIKDLTCKVSTRDVAVLQLNKEVGRFQQSRQEKVVEIQHLSETIKELQEALFEKQVMLDKLHLKATEDYNILISHRDDVIKKLKEDLNESQMQHTERYNEVLKCEIKISELQLENQTLGDQIQSSSQILSQMTEHVREMELQLTISQEKHRTCVKEVGARDESLLKVQEELDVMRLKYVGCTDELTARDYEIQRHNLQLKQLQNDVKALKSQLALSEEKCDNGTKVLRQQEQEIVKLQHEVKQHQKIKEQLNADQTLLRNAHSLEVNHFKKEIDALKATLENVKKELTSATVAFEKQKGHVDALDKKLAKEQEACQDAIDEVNKRGLEIEHQDEKLKDLTYQLSISKQELDLAEKRIDQLRCEAEAYRKKSDSAVDDVSNLETSFAKTTDQLTLALKQSMEKDAELMHLTDDLTRALATADDKESDLVNTRTAVARLESELQEKQNDFQHAIEELAKKDSTILYLNEQVALLTSEAFCKEDALQRLQAEFSLYKEKYCHENSELLEKENVIQQMKLEAEQSQNELQLKLHELADFSQNMEDFKRQLCCLREQKKQLEDQVNKLEQINQEILLDRASSHQMLLSEKTRLREQVKQLAHDVTGSKRQIGLLEKELLERGELSSQLTVELRILKEEILQKVEEISQLEVLQKQKVNELTESQSNIRALQGQVVESEHLQLTLKEELEATISQFKDATQERVHLEEKFILLEQSLSSIQEKLSLKVTEMAKLENSNRKLQIELGAVKDQNACYENEISSKMEMIEKLHKDLLVEKEDNHRKVQEFVHHKQKFSSLEYAFESEKENQRHLSGQLVQKDNLITQLQQELSVSGQQRQDLAKQLQITKKTVADLQDEIDLYQRRDHEVSCRLHDQETLNGRVREENEALHQKIQKLREELADKDGELQVSKMNLDTLQKQIQHQHSEVARSEELIAQLKTDLEKSQSHQSKTLGQLLECQKQVHDCTVQLSTLQGNHKDTLDQLAEKSRQVIILKTELNHETQKSQTMADEIGFYEDKMKRLKLEQSKLQDKNKQNENEHQRSDKACQELQNELSVVMDRNRHILGELTVKDEALTNLKIEFSSLQEKLKKQIRENDEIKGELHSLQIKLRHVNEENCNLNKELDAERLKHDKLHHEGEIVTENVRQLIKEQRLSNENLGLKIREKNKAIMQLTSEREQLLSQILVMEEERNQLCLDLDKRKIDDKKYQALQKHSSEQQTVIHQLRKKLAEQADETEQKLQEKQLIIDKLYEQQHTNAGSVHCLSQQLTHLQQQHSKVLTERERDTSMLQVHKQLQPINDQMNSNFKTDTGI